MQVIMSATGEVKNVSTGYARNYLFPNGLAKPATADSLQSAEATRAQFAQKLANDQASFQALADKLKSFSLTIPVKTTASGTLFAALHSGDIASALATAGVMVTTDNITCPPIKKIGDHSVTIKLPDCKPVTITVKVQSAAS